MERIPQGKYILKFRAEDAKLLEPEKLSVWQAAKRLLMSLSSLDNRVLAERASKLAKREITGYIEIFYNRQWKQARLGYLSSTTYAQQYHANR
jgi:hypothetical protein